MRRIKRINNPLTNPKNFIQILNKLSKIGDITDH